MQFAALILFGLVASLKQSPSSIDELIGWVYPDNAPQFTPISSPAMMAIAGNDTAIMKVSHVDVEPYPLRPGYVDFTYLHNIVGDIPAESTMMVHSYVDGTKWFEGEVDICTYLPFARLECPIKAYHGIQRNTTKLQVPDNGYDNRFSFVARVETPAGKTILHLAAIVDCIEAVKEDL